MTPPLSSYAAEIYQRGLTGETPPLPTDPAALEDAARAVLDDGTFGYVAGGAGSGATLRANRAAFDRYAFVPRMLRDTTVRDWSTTLLGTAMPAPLLLAPVGMLALLHPEGELATARAAAEVGVPIVLSTVSSHTIEEVADASADGPRWYQLYWPTEDAVTVSLLERARAAGYATLVVTLDTWTLGWRPADLDRGDRPMLRGAGAAVPFSDPAFRAGLAAPPEEDRAAAVARWASMFTGTALRWDRLDLLRRHWPGPIVLKGVQHPADAARAVDAGMDGVVVSNHGGRQVDRAIGALDALPGIVEAVGERAAVLFDSGVRTGADAAVALALGADAVLLGRPYAYGLALAGEEGVRHVLRCVLAELDLTLALTGHASLAGLRADPDALVRRG
jgi:isopentenyl diphosphate isomerase/L-lactate dehydrogenase-like FMN-dependent dehydrogenase